MSYRVRFTMPDGRTDRLTRDYATREEAQRAIDGCVYDTGFAYTVEEVPNVSTAAVPDASPDPTASQWLRQPAQKPTSTTERLVGLLRDRHARGIAKYGTTLDRGDLTPEQWAQHAIDEALDLAGYLMRVKDWFAPDPGSTAAHHVEILRARIKELEAMIKECRKAVTNAHVANHAMHVRLSRAIELGDAMHRAMTTAQSRFYMDWGEIKVALAEWTEFKDSLAASVQGTAKASEAPGEGGDSGSSSFEALEAFLRADTCRSIQAIEDGRFIVVIPGLIGNPASRTLEGIAARVEEMTKSNAEWLKPISRPKDKFGEGTNRWRLNALERFLDGDDAASLTWHEGEFYAVAEDVAITAPTLLALADKLAEKEAKP